MNMIVLPDVATRDQEQAVEVLTRAFAADPVARWVYPDNEQYRTSFPAFIRAFAGKAFEYGTAYEAPGGSGAALWLPPHIHPDDDAVAAVIEATVPTPKRDEVFALMEQMGRYHPSEPHWYLPLIGVSPAQHGRGLGTELLQRALERCDRECGPAYLEATTVRSRMLYERLGFRVTGTIQTGSSPPMYPMAREPQPGRSFLSYPERSHAEVLAG